MSHKPIRNKATMATTVILNGPDQGKVIWNAAREVPMVVTFRANGVVLDRIRVVASTDDQAIQRARVDTIARCSMHGLPMPMLDDATASIDTSRIKAGLT
jgi:hypothetical protein